MSSLGLEQGCDKRQIRSDQISLIKAMKIRKRRERDLEEGFVSIVDGKGDRAVVRVDKPPNLHDPGDGSLLQYREPTAHALCVDQL